MAIFETQSPFNNNAPVANNNADRPKTQVYGNAGYWAVDPETQERTHISLPLGLGIDTMTPKAAGKSQLMQAKNALLTQLKELSEKLAPGEEMEIPLTFVLRRVANHEQQDATNNSFIAQMGDLAQMQKAG